MPHRFQLILSLFLLIGCNTKNDIKPNDLIGVYTFSSISDLKEDSQQKNIFQFASDIEFSENGKGFVGETKFDYFISDNTVTIKHNGRLLNLTFYIANDILKLDIGNKELISLFDVINIFGEEYLFPDNGISILYNKLNDEVLVSPKIPDCRISFRKTELYQEKFHYDNKGFVSSIENVKTKEIRRSFKIFPENLGSDSLPYIIEVNANLINKYYCNRYGWVKKTEFGDLKSSDNFMIAYTSYDFRGQMFSKIIVEYGNQIFPSSQLSGIVVRDYIYSTSGEIKIYQSLYDTNLSLINPRYLFYENILNMTSTNTALVFPFRYGTIEENVFAIKKGTTYFPNGSIRSTYICEYKNNPNGYVESENYSTTIYNVDNKTLFSSIKNTYQYECNVL